MAIAADSTTQGSRKPSLSASFSRTKALISAREASSCRSIAVITNRQRCRTGRAYVSRKSKSVLVIALAEGISYHGGIHHLSQGPLSEAAVGFGDARAGADPRRVQDHEPLVQGAGREADLDLPHVAGRPPDRTSGSQAGP